MSVHSLWPDLPLSAWSETCDTLQLWTQIVGKVRIATTPLINHWWNATLFVTARGLEAPAMRHAGDTFDVLFDLAGHRLVVQTNGRVEEFALRPMAVADFYAEFMHRLRRLGIEVLIWTMPCEIENSVPFTQDRIHAQYDREYVARFHQALVQSARVMNEFRARFVGKVSPVHFFWGSFDLAATRFSGRTAPPPKGVTPNVAPWVMAEAYSHECSSCGFYNKDLGEFILPYDAVRRARDPDALSLGFLQETYAAAADLAKWDRNALERGNESQDRVDAPQGHLRGG